MSEVDFLPICGFRGGKFPDTYRPGDKYESPINLNYIEEIATRLSEELDNQTFAAMLKAGITVDRDEMIKALSYDRDQYRKGYYDGFTDGQKPCWIPVTERLPEKKKAHYLCLLNDDSMEVVYWSKVPDWASKGEWTWHSSNWKNVTHWMPLPTPPKEEIS